MAKKTDDKAKGKTVLAKGWFWILAIGVIGTLVVFGEDEKPKGSTASEKTAETAIANFEKLVAAESEAEAEADSIAEVKIQEAEDRANAEAQAAAEARLKDPVNYRTDISYMQLSQTPADYYNELITMSGRVLQVTQGEDSSQLLIAVADNYDTVFFMEYDTDISEANISENDYVSFYGIAAGTVSYESSQGEIITLPAAYVNMIELQ